MHKESKAMNEKTLSMKCRPSQVVNLQTFLLTLLVIPIIILLNEMLKTQLPRIPVIPDKLTFQVYRLPVYLSVIAGLNLAYQVLQIRCTRYEIGMEEIKCYSGIFKRKLEFIENYRVKDYFIERPLLYRMFGLGTLTLYTSDKTTPVLRMEAIRDPEEKYDILRGFVERSRREKHVFEVDRS